jgi:magnesium-protoporphyrin O-methyltransferase
VTARRALDRYRRRGLDDLERRMVEAVEDVGLEGARVLDLGGGVGAIAGELLQAGAAEAEIVELVEAWRPYADDLARERGLEGRTTFRVVDVLAAPDAVDSADVVVLNRVVCCSEDGVELTAEAARHTRRVLVLSFPRDAVWTRASVGALNAAMWALGRSYRAFVHPPAALAGAAEANGLRRSAGGRGFLWEYASFVRP